MSDSFVPKNLQVQREGEAVEGKVDEAREEVEDTDLQVVEVEKVIKVGGAGEKEKEEEEEERRVSIEIIEDANNMLIEESEEEGFKSEDSENNDSWNRSFQQMTPVIQFFKIIPLSCFYSSRILLLQAVSIGCGGMDVYIVLTDQSKEKVALTNTLSRK